MSKLRYMLFGDPKVDFTKPVLPGLFQWANAFNAWDREGVIFNIVCKEELERYDVIHVNWTSGHPSYISAIRDALGDSSTTIIANVDFGVGLHDIIDPLIMKDTLIKADMIFHVEPFGARRLSNYLERNVPCIPHPCDVERIKKFRKGTYLPPTISCQFHRYGSTWAIYYYATQRLLKKYPELRSVLYNVTDYPPHHPSLEDKFSSVVPVAPYAEYLDDLSRCYINLDLPPDYTYGRGIVDAAALGIPTIGSDTVFAQQMIYPELACNCVDAEQVEKALEQMLLRPDDYSEFSERGKDKCKFFDLYNSHNRMVEELEKRNLA